MSEFANWCYVKHRDRIEVLDGSYPDVIERLCAELGAPVNRDSAAWTFIDWEQVTTRYTCDMYWEGTERLLPGWLRSSALARTGHVVIDFGYDGPAVRVPTQYFIDNIWDFIRGTGFETVVLSDCPGVFAEYARRGDLFHASFPLDCFSKTHKD